MPEPTSHDVKEGMARLELIAGGESRDLLPVEAEALLRHVRTLYLKGFNFGLETFIHAQKLAKERAHSGDALIDADSVSVDRALRPE